MKYLTHVLSFAVFGSCLVASAASCSGPAAGVSSFTGGAVSTSSGSASTGDDDTSNGAPAAPAPASDPIFGSNAFAFTAPAENADDHTDGTHAGKVPMEGQGCVVASCHLGGTQPWVIAGSVFAAVGGGAFTGQAEIGIVTPDNKGILLYTDKQGNFWTDTGDPPPAGSFVGIRVAGQQTLKMGEGLPAPPQSQNCNDAACHGLPSNRIYASLN